MLDPWSYAAKTNTEHAHQVALFAWCNTASRFGTNIANDPHSYTVVGFAIKQFEGGGSLGYIRYSKPLPLLFRLFAIHNQGHGDAIRGNRAVAEGVKAGVPDMMLPVLGGNRYPGGVYQFQGLFIELKRTVGARLSSEQADWITYLNDAGYCAKTCFGWLDARDCLLTYLGERAT